MLIDFAVDFKEIVQVFLKAAGRPLAEQSENESQLAPSGGKY